MTITESLRLARIRPSATFAGPVPRSTEHLELVIYPPSLPRASKRLIESTDQPLRR